jgi:hypothetical protein
VLDEAGLNGQGEVDLDEFIEVSLFFSFLVFQLFSSWGFSFVNISDHLKDLW